MANLTVEMLLNSHIPMSSMLQEILFFEVFPSYDEVTTENGKRNQNIVKIRIKLELAKYV